MMISPPYSCVPWCARVFLYINLLNAMRMPKIMLDISKCYGCRSCELACSYHFARAFNPEMSSIKVLRDGENGEVTISITSTCDFCEGEAHPFCVKYCAYGALSLDENE